MDSILSPSLAYGSKALISSSIIEPQSNRLDGTCLQSTNPCYAFYPEQTHAQGIVGSSMFFSLACDSNVLISSLSIEQNF